MSYFNDWALFHILFVAHNLHYHKYVPFTIMCYIMPVKTMLMQCLYYFFNQFFTPLNETSAHVICIMRVSKCFDLSIVGDCFMCTISPTYQSTSQANVSPWKILRLSVRRQTPRGRDTLTAALKVLPSVAEYNTLSQTVMLHSWPLFPVSCPKRVERQFKEIILNWDSVKKWLKQEAQGETEYLLLNYARD